MGTVYSDVTVLNPAFKNIKDAQEIAWAKRYLDTTLTYANPIFDPIGPVKYDVPDVLVRSVVEQMAAVQQRLSTVEEHLATGVVEGRAFVPAAQRPEVGNDLLQQTQGQLKLMQERLDRVEESLTEE